ncbi:hypothetical protein ACFL6E_00075 [Candidatus Neomarinimicrobiota bacterium]
MKNQHHAALLFSIVLLASITNAQQGNGTSAPDYDLMPLPDVERYIAEHQHLPDVPSAEEVAANGLSLGASQAMLLQKIEELTLYMIDLKNENQELKTKFEQLTQ